MISIKIESESLVIDIEQREDGTSVATIRDKGDRGGVVEHPLHEYDSLIEAVKDCIVIAEDAD